MGWDNRRMQCATCETPVGWIDCPTGGWWAHATHPADGHDAQPMPASEQTGAELAEACGKCKTPFDPADTRFDGHARHKETPYCRSCVDLCHEATDAFHRCVICDTYETGQ